MIWCVGVIRIPRAYAYIVRARRKFVARKIAKERNTVDKYCCSTKRHQYIYRSGGKKNAEYERDISRKKMRDLKRTQARQERNRDKKSKKNRDTDT